MFIRQAFALQAREDQIIKGQSAALLRAMAQIRRLVETLPPEDSLFRERAWRELLPQVRDALRPYNEEFANQIRLISAELRPELCRYLDWMRSNERAINNVVTKGILDAAPTEEIAEGIVQIIRRQGIEYISTAGPTAGRTIESDAKAIARTAVQDANRQVHEQVWKANEDALSDLEWEWVAVLDSRTCPICAPLDGKRWKKRTDADQWPAHVNCRCQVVAVNPDAAADVRTGIVIGEKPFSPKKEGTYKTKVKVKGKKYFRQARSIKPIKGEPVTYADFLATSNALTRKKFFPNEKSLRIFENSLAKNVDPNVALLKALRR